MPFSYRELFCARTKFCCCIPVRLGVIVMAVLGIIFSAVLSIALWYELSVNHTMGPGVRAAFVIGGLVETFLFAASIFGLVGAIVRKLSFIRIYAYITYVHFLLNIGVAIWFLVVVSRTANSADANLCNPAGDAQEQCAEIFSFARTFYIVLALLVLVIELYGALIVTRYVWQLSREKSDKRQTRLEVAGYYVLASSHELTHSRSPTFGNHNETEYDPYREASIPAPVPAVQTPRRFKTVTDQGRSATPVEVGYGGGTWTHEEISEEEKARLRRLEREQGLDIDDAPPLDEAEAVIRRSEIKTVGGGGPTTYVEAEELPRYPDPPTEPHL